MSTSPSRSLSLREPFSSSELLSPFSLNFFSFFFSFLRSFFSFLDSFLPLRSGRPPSSSESSSITLMLSRPDFMAALDLVWQAPSTVPALTALTEALNALVDKEDLSPLHLSWEMLARARPAWQDPLLQEASPSTLQIWFLLLRTLNRAAAELLPLLDFGARGSLPTHLSGGFVIHTEYARSLRRHIHRRRPVGDATDIPTKEEEEGSGHCGAEGAGEALGLDLEQSCLLQREREARSTAAFPHRQ